MYVQNNLHVDSTATNILFTVHSETFITSEVTWMTPLHGTALLCLELIRLLIDRMDEVTYIMKSKRVEVTLNVKTQSRRGFVTYRFNVRLDDFAPTWWCYQSQIVYKHAFFLDKQEGVRFFFFSFFFQKWKVITYEGGRLGTYLLSSQKYPHQTGGTILCAEKVKIVWMPWFEYIWYLFT